MIRKYIIKKEINMEFRNNTSLFLITPTMCVLIIVFPILSENRFRVDNDLFLLGKSKRVSEVIAILDAA